MKQTQEAYIVSAIRTPVGKINGALANVRPDDLLASVLKKLLADNPRLDPSAIEDVVIGCAIPEAEQGLNVARISLLLAGYPDNVPGVTVNRFCSSGLQSIASAAERIQLGLADVMVAGGVESMSRVPIMGNAPSLSPAIFEQEDYAIAYGMGITAEKVAEKYNVSRRAQDEFAFESHRRALLALENNAFADETLPIDVIHSQFDAEKDTVVNSTKTVSQDEGPRADTNLEVLGKLRTAFAKDGSVTAGNSSQMSDGAGAVLICSERALKTFRLAPLAKFHAYSVIGVPPEIMGIGPVKAIPHALKRAGLNQSQLEWIELNEAFAAQSVAVINELGLDPEKVNPLGGAISLGHPLGATGAIRTATVLHGMKKNGLNYGMTTMCVGTGMGAAAVFENMGV